MAGCPAAFTRPGVLAVLGLAVGHIFAAAMGWGAWEVPGALAACGAAGMLLVGRVTMGFIVCFCLFFAGLGGGQRAWLQAREDAAFKVLEALADGGAPLAQVRGRIEGVPVRTGSGWVVVVGSGGTVGVGARESELGAPVAMRVSLRRPGAEALASAVTGDSVVAMGELLELPRQAAAGEPNEWLRGSGAVAVLNAGRVEVVRESMGVPGWSAALRVAAGAASGAEEWMLRALGEREGALLVAMTVGRTQHLTPEQREAFRRAGLYHAFSVSGLHTVLVGGLMVLVLRLFGLRAWVRVLLLGLLLVGFCAFVGIRTPVVRAAGLLLLFDARDLLRRPVEPLAALGSVAAILLVLWPRSIFQLDFQMSFLCMVALVLTQPWMLALQMAVGRRWGWTWRAAIVGNALQTLCVSVAIQLAMTPLLLETFGEVSVVAPVANMLVLGVASWCVAGGFVLMILALVLPPSVADPLLYGLMELPLWLMDEVVEWLASVPGAVWEGEPFPLWLAGLLYAVLLGSAWNQIHVRWRPRRSIWAFAPGALGVAAVFVWLPLARPLPGGLDVWFLDVGQGDAILMRSPEGRTGLVDAGPEDAWYLAEMLRRRGVRGLDFVLASHADGDHVGGLAELLREIPVKVVYTNGDITSSKEAEDVAAELARRGVRTEVVLAGNEIAWSREVDLRVLHPGEEGDGSSPERNAASVVLRVEYAGVVILLTGDAEESAEATMLQESGLLDADVLKLGHHGSNTSTGREFLDAVSPRTAVVSCGRNNRYGHPAVEVLRRLEAGGVDVLRTDLQGSLHLHVEGGGRMLWSAGRAGEVARRW